MLLSIFALTAGMFTFLHLVQNGTFDIMTYAQAKELEQKETAASSDAGAYFAEAEDDDSDGLEFSFHLSGGIGKDDVEVSINQMSQTLMIDIDGADDNYVTANPLSGASTHINDLLLYSYDDGYGYEITLDDYYECETAVEDGEFKISLVDPHEKYDYIVVIDPGHGGSDSPGTVWNGVKESDITLEIGNAIMKYQEQLAEMGIGLYTTRTEDVYTYLSGRCAMANGLDADLFLSIHCNSIPGYWDDATSGVETLYSQKDKKGNSKALAQLLSEKVAESTSSRDRGAVMGDEIYIIRKAKVPVALCEVGFMSNHTELSNLQTKSYRKKVAEGFYNTIIYAFENGLDAEEAKADSTVDNSATEDIVNNENDEN